LEVVLAVVYFVVAEAGVVCFAAADPVVVVVRLVANDHSDRGKFRVGAAQVADNSAASYSGSAVVAEADKGAAVEVEGFAVVFVVVVGAEWVAEHSASFALVRPRVLEHEALAVVVAVAVVLVTVVGAVEVVAEQMCFEQIRL
jgi:hypothetical protein